MVTDRMINKLLENQDSKTERKSLNITNRYGIF